MVEGNSCLLDVLTLAINDAFYFLEQSSNFCRHDSPDLKVKYSSCTHLGRMARSAFYQYLNYSRSVELAP